ncbi:anti-sigma factor family protein [Streptomyces monticola]|uniref:Anti-sigma factor family protein n=1 Tax=Streptomyces monticola TaxID=2666263 RepID=A0ABW2JG38_9ACTN
MSGSRPTPAEQHLGDRLAALVDGELGHDTRERVLAHLATCAKCKAEADAQRRLKTYFASTAPPPPSENFLARLQGLSADGDDGRGDGFGGSVTDAFFGPGAGGVFGVRHDSFGYAPSGTHGGILPGGSRDRGLPGGSRERGFRIHDVGRPAQDRPSGSRGRRFAFAAAGAVSLAAIALGGVSTGVPAPADASASADARGSKASPMRTQGTNSSTAPDSQRRRGSGGPPSAGAQGVRPGALAAPVDSTGVAAPGVPGLPGDRPPRLQGPPASPMLTGSAALSPLIRPASGTPQFPAGTDDGGRAGPSKSSPFLATPPSALPSPSLGTALSSRR